MGNNIFLFYNDDSITLGGRSISILDQKEWDDVFTQTDRLIARKTLQRIKLIIALEIIDSGSIKTLVRYIRHLKDNTEINVVWKYSESEEKELGEDISTVIDLPFEYQKTISLF